MAHKRKGQLTVTGEWAKHLRKFWRRQFWNGERIAGKKILRFMDEEIVSYSKNPDEGSSWNEVKERVLNRK